MVLPHTVDVDINIDGVWTSITDDVRILPSSIQFGSQDGEQNNRGPATCTLVLDNRAGKFSPLNPESPYYGKFQRGTLIRVLINGSLRFQGYVTSLTPELELSGSDHRIAVLASGLRQRLMQNQQPLKTTLERGMPTMSGIVAYYPMTESKYATEFEDVLGSAPPAQWDGKLTPAASDKHPASGAIPTLDLGAQVYMDFPGYPTTGVLRTMMWVNVPTDLTAWTGWRPLFYLWTSASTTRRWTLEMNEGGSLRVRLYVDGVISTGSIFSFGMAGKSGLLWLYLTNQAAGTVRAQIGFAESRKGAGVGVGEFDFTGGVFTGTAAQLTLQGTHPELGMGHVSVINSTSFWASVNFARAWDGELAVDRFQRLAAEEGVTVGIAGGNPTQAMGMQRADTFLNLMDECADADDALMWDAHITTPHLRYRSRGSMYSQPSELVLDFAAGHLSPPLQPVLDDRLTMNDVTVSRRDGGRWRSVERDGPLGVDIVGAYTASEERNFSESVQTISMARWLLHRGTAEGLRLEQLTIDLTANPALALAAYGLRPGSFVTVTNLPTQLTPDDVKLLVVGLRYDFDEVNRKVVLTCVPGEPFNVAYTFGNPDTDAFSRVDADGCTLATADFVTGTSTAMVVNVPNLPWTTLASEWPFNIRVDGAVLTVTAVSAVVGGQQGFTISSTVVNGVVKTLTAGSEVHVEPTANVAA